MAGVTLGPTQAITAGRWEAITSGRVIPLLCVGATYASRGADPPTRLPAGVVGIYNKLYDMYSAHQLFYIIGVFYACVFSVMGLLLRTEMENTTPDPSRPLGWVSYCAIESFGSIGGWVAGVNGGGGGNLAAPPPL